MAEVVRIIEPLTTADGTTYSARVCGRPNGHLWEGWIEFVTDDAADVRRTPRETTQPDRDALIYWSQGLSITYLEGALARTGERLKITRQKLPEPYFDEPAPAIVTETILAEPTTGRAVLDPFSVGAKGEDLLRRELGALRAWHLRNIIRAYKLADDSLDLERLSAPELVELIVDAVQPA